MGPWPFAAFDSCIRLKISQKVSLKDRLKDGWHARSKEHAQDRLAVGVTENPYISVTLLRPKIVVVTQWSALLCASGALAQTAWSLSASLWLVMGVATLPWLVQALSRSFYPSQQPNQFLRMHPFRVWQIVSEQPLAVSYQNVQPLQCWRHFFGLTLSLKILNCPHNKQEAVRMTLWRHNIDAELYRRACVMIAWRLDCPQIEPEPESV